MLETAVASCRHTLVRIPGWTLTGLTFVRFVQGILRAMEANEGHVETWCPVCRSPVFEEALKVCVICRRLFCHRCAVQGYGREFCSTRCRDFFFYGEGEDGEDS